MIFGLVGYESVTLSTLVAFPFGSLPATLLMGQASNETWAVPKLDIVAIEHPLCLLGGLIIVRTNNWFESDEMPVASDSISPIFLHRLSIQRSQFTTKKLCDIGRPKRIAAVAIDTTEFTSASFDKHEFHRLVALRADRRRGVFRHDAHARSGASVVCSQSPISAETGAVMVKFYRHKNRIVCTVHDSSGKWASRSFNNCIATLNLWTFG
jgi:hypothetical protein